MKSEQNSLFPPIGSTFWPNGTFQRPLISKSSDWPKIVAKSGKQYAFKTHFSGRAEHVLVFNYQSHKRSKHADDENRVRNHQKMAMCNYFYCGTFQYCQIHFCMYLYVLRNVNRICIFLETWLLTFFCEREVVFRIFRDAWKVQLLLRERRGIGDPHNYHFENESNSGKFH